MCTRTDKHCETENKYRNIKDHNNKCPTANDMALFFYTFFDQQLSILATLIIHLFMQFYQLNGSVGNLCIFFAFAFIEENCLNKLSLLCKDLMSYTVRNLKQYGNSIYGIIHVLEMNT